MKIIPALLTSLLTTTCLLSTSSLSAIPIATDVSQKLKPATIKALLVKQADKPLIEVKGSYEIFNPLNNYYISTGFLDKRDYIKADEYGIRWGDLLPGIFQFRIVPKDSNGFVLVNGIQYKGVVEIYLINNKFNVVNEIDMESYLKTTLSLQISRPLPDSVLDSLAILARTNAYFFVQKNANAYWHVEPEEVHYYGYGLNLQNLPVERAIERTRHAILTLNNSPFPTSWTENSAGKTAAFSSIFRKDFSAPQGVQTPFAAKDREKSHWSFSISKAELAKLVHLPKASTVDLFVDKTSNKVYGAKIGDGTHSKNLDFFQLQKALGAQKLRSSDFTATINEDTVSFEGFGEGHGVGLCLYSAAQMAKRGDSAAKMLTAFFPHTKLQRVRSLSDNEIASLETSFVDKR